MIDTDWPVRLLPILFWIPAAAFCTVIVYSLWTGAIYAVEDPIRRSKAPRTYWTAIAFFALCAVATIWMALRQ